MSTVTWYICAIGSWIRNQESPRFSVSETPPSKASAIRSPSVGSIQMSWKSHPGDDLSPRKLVVVWVSPPFRLQLKLDEAK